MGLSSIISDKVGLIESESFPLLSCSNGSGGNWSVASSTPGSEPIDLFIVAVTLPVM